MKTDKTAFGLLVLLIVGLMFISGCAQVQQKLSTSDISISDFEYDRISIDSQGDIIADASFIISTNKEWLQYKVLDINNEPLTAPAMYLKVGNNKFNAYSWKLDSLYQQPQIQICFSKEFDLDGYAPDMVCKIETFETPEIDVSINPDPLIFSISKNGLKSNYKTVSVTNNGNVKIDFRIYVPIHEVGRYDYPEHYPSYSIDTLWLKLSPGQSDTFSTAPVAGNIGEFTTPPGTYESTGYIWAISPSNSLQGALFKKSFTLKTTVTE